MPNLCRVCFEKWDEFSRLYQLLLKTNEKLKKLARTCSPNDSVYTGTIEEENKIFIETETTANLIEVEKYETSSPFYQDSRSNSMLEPVAEQNNIDETPLSDENVSSISPSKYDIKTDTSQDSDSDSTFPDRNDDFNATSETPTDDTKETITKPKQRRGRRRNPPNDRNTRLHITAKACRNKYANAANAKKALYRCEPCKKYFYEKMRYEGHVKIVHEGVKKGYECQECGKAYKFYKNLTEHITSNHSASPSENLLCQLCNKQFKTQTTLKNHMKIKHPTDPESTINSRRVICDQCGFLAASVESLTAHIKNLHTEAEHFKCEQCPKVFKCRYYLKHHTMTHHSEVKIKPFKCNFCEMAFSRRNGLTKHELTHLDYTERIKCDFEGCDVRFLNTDAKKRHTRLVHLKEKQHICDICGEAFGIKATLRHHRYIHTGEKPYKCPECGQGFRQHTAMKTHAKTHLKAAKTIVQSAEAVQ
ncbi:zinc finger and SCAN domain-containing protein 12 isoform X2 [Musca domestica]|nr:zinc finger and SCAN domain-containing protein 12 isoform X2 [Musca domestica]